MTKIVQPGACIGVLGSGQLGRMFAIAARQMGYRVHVLSPDDDTPTGQVADVEIKASYRDLDAVAAFARQVEVVTFEFENVPDETAAAAGRFAPVRPAGQVLHTTQNRLREKTFLKDAGLPVTRFAPVRSLDDIDAAVASVGLPGVLKSASWGYDGKGQRRVATRDDVQTAWESLGANETILEALVSFSAEVSVVAARDARGEIACFDPFVNVHTNHILDITSSPGGLPPQVESRAIEIARIVMSQLEVVGVLCVEMFLTVDGELLVNELAPRPHNSGHLTIDAHISSQFEQQVRAVCGLPLGSTSQLRPAAMANLLGDLWSAGPPQWDRACALPEVKLHLYGKRQPLPGRKMGHLTALADSTEAAIALAVEARRQLTAS